MFWAPRAVAGPDYAGVPPLAAHLFVMYYACLSALTPPVCVAVFMASGHGQIKLV